MSRIFRQYALPSLLALLLLTLTGVQSKDVPIKYVNYWTDDFSIVRMHPKNVPIAKHPHHGVAWAFGGQRFSENDFQGDMVHVAFWDEMGHPMGASSNWRTQLKQGHATQAIIPWAAWALKTTPTYMSVVKGGRNAACISAINVKFPNGELASVTGDMFKACGEAEWYYSDLRLGDGSDGHAPHCFWIDEDHSNGIHFQGHSFHLPSFTPTAELQKDFRAHKENMCHPIPRFASYAGMGRLNPIQIFDPPLANNVTADNNTITNWWEHMAWSEAAVDVKKVVVSDVREFENDKKPPRMTKRDSRARKLVLSKHPKHPARDLCTSATSRGPDFVSFADNLFCDMENKVLYPICDAGEQEHCFDTFHHTMRTPNVMLLGLTSNATAVDSPYECIETWYDEERGEDSMNAEGLQQAADEDKEIAE